MTNTLTNTRIEYHILQSFPVSCLNRDDVGAPKTALIGGTTRARVSSQCWKRQVRLALADLGIKLGIRTKHLAIIIEKHCIAAGATVEQAQACAKKIADAIGDNTLLFIADHEAKGLAEYAQKAEFDETKIQDKEIAKVIKKVVTKEIDALDIALFGRMVAKAAELNVEAAASFSHAISTHKVSNEIDFFTAMDDQLQLDELEQKQGSSHMGSLEYNSATYYRYISLDLGQLCQSLDKDDLKLAVEAFTKALFIAVPSARQTTMSGASTWDYARVLVRKGQRIQLPFETAIKKNNDGYLASSIDCLKQELSKKEKMCGSLFGKVADYEWGENDSFSIDDLISSLKNHIS